MPTTESDPFSEAAHSGVRTEGSTDGLPVAPELSLSLDAARMPRRSTLIDRRVLRIIGISMVLGAAAGLIAKVLMVLIGLITNLAFYGRWSTEFSAPAEAVPHLGAWVILIPVIGGLIAGLMARWGSRAIRGHGIPEAMEQVLQNESRIPTRITFLKPISSAIVIGTGGPFGAEGPIIATGGALGSMVGQFLRVTASERKVLLAAGAAAGMAAIFSAPIAAVALAVELLLFELRPRSLIPVALACVVATGMRYLLMGTTPVFLMDTLVAPGGVALALYVAIGALLGLISVGVTHAVYGIEDAFEKLPVHWMWWPAIGAVVVGIVGYFAPLTLGVGYTNIEDILNGRLTFGALAFLCVMKFISWSVSLSSGTSGGTLAPLFTIGGALGAMAGIGLSLYFPGLGIDPRIAALVGMAAIFAGASRALFTTVIFAFETTGQPAGLLPLLGACTAAYLVSAVLMRNTIMTEKIVRRGVRVPSEYKADYLERVLVGDVCETHVVTLSASQTLAQVQAWIAQGRPESQHQGYPVMDAAGRALGVLTRRTFFDPAHLPSATLGELIKRPPIAVTVQHTLREAADHMVVENVGRLLVVDPSQPGRVLGMLTRGDLLSAHGRRLREGRRLRRHLSFTTYRRMRRRRAALR
ncbi:chloride channel protein [Eoetvoesiella caeni]|uniref:H+/Cl-antiporter ClcA n=1 Tax=Eoetvoesiella caeni TaxID=645616 RepID=A0A366HCW0_9BURK|nr:chloride channel protein [Eoetvoesiella caeni]MCI2809170.1 chloride channel protein [Eoetvoesiella caeni]RBP39503.1 H+/Cl- antiporter ClcA [Eoetvoesiella caeni]